MKAYDLLGLHYIGTYTTIKKAKEVTYEHRDLDFEIKETRISLLCWLILKLMLK